MIDTPKEFLCPRELFAVPSGQWHQSCTHRGGFSLHSSIHLLLRVMMMMEDDADDDDKKKEEKKGELCCCSICSSDVLLALLASAQ